MVKNPLGLFSHQNLELLARLGGGGILAEIEKRPKKLQRYQKILDDLFSIDFLSREVVKNFLLLMGPRIFGKLRPFAHPRNSFSRAENLRLRPSCISQKITSTFALCNTSEMLNS